MLEFDGQALDPAIVSAQPMKPGQTVDLQQMGCPTSELHSVSYSPHQILSTIKHWMQNANLLCATGGAAQAGSWTPFVHMLLPLQLLILFLESWGCVGATAHWHTPTLIWMEMNRPCGHFRPQAQHKHMVMVPQLLMWVKLMQLNNFSCFSSSKWACRSPDFLRRVLCQGWNPHRWVKSESWL